MRSPRALTSLVLGVAAAIACTSAGDAGEDASTDDASASDVTVSEPLGDVLSEPIKMGEPQPPPPVTFPGQFAEAFGERVADGCYAAQLDDGAPDAAIAA